MDFKKIYNLFEDDITTQPETTAAEAAIRATVAKLKDADPDLFFELDSAIGALARAYEKQGFAGGLVAAREIAMIHSV